MHVLRTIDSHKIMQIPSLQARFGEYLVSDQVTPTFKGNYPEWVHIFSGPPLSTVKTLRPYQTLSEPVRTCQISRGPPFSNVGIAAVKFKVIQSSSHLICGSSALRSIGPLIPLSLEEMIGALVFNQFSPNRLYAYCIFGMITRYESAFGPPNILASTLYDSDRDRYPYNHHPLCPIKNRLTLHRDVAEPAAQLETGRISQACIRRRSLREALKELLMSSTGFEKVREIAERSSAFQHMRSIQYRIAPVSIWCHE
ncbi:hypothetical protein PCH_Pc13g15330 [Penicillium rubens Wisconsin 54-1255]|uniref:Uncharacterized protein n=1 Tax=Penicillium rubens (strain ATCC 28089 / DSM 1075 / NRRL 1951 / Wisconsin 54-1255) TaxID=500485 RepID=B6H2R2_PENRW|nr:hypothetical protein PCH_Pc13g15330 [Penicillium rubens Wisconsin 54-1255]